MPPEFFSLLSRGASAAGACAQLDVPIADYFDARSDPDFRDHEELIGTLLAQNLFAALYRAGMEGNVSAATAWLKHHPAGIAVTNRDNSNSLSDKTDAELIAQAKAWGLAIPPEFADRIHGTNGEVAAAELPEHPAAADEPAAAVAGFDSTVAADRL